MSFDLENYETVKERKKRFYSDHEDGRIIVEILNIDSINEYAVFKATTYKSAEDQEKGLPFSTGHAHESRDTELSISKSGNEYASVNYSAWVENCEESAIGRALDNAGYAGNDKCSQEEMKKVEHKTGGKSQSKLDFNQVQQEIKTIKDFETLESYFEELVNDNPGMTEKQGYALGKIKERRQSEIKDGI